MRSLCVVLAMMVALQSGCRGGSSDISARLGTLLARKASGLGIEAITASRCVAVGKHRYECVIEYGSEGSATSTSITFTCDERSCVGSFPEGQAVVIELEK